jgi:hypothetical protein
MPVNTILNKETHTNTQITIDELLTSKFELKLKGDKITQASYGRFFQKHYSYSHILKERYFNISFFAIPHAVSDKKAYRLFLEYNERKKASACIYDHKLTHGISVPKMKKSKLDKIKFKRPIPLPSEQKHKIGLDFSKELGELGVLLHTKEVVGTREQIPNFNDVIIHLIYPFGSLCYIPSFDYFTITTTQNQSDRLNIDEQKKRIEEINLLYSSSGSRYTELREMFDGNMIWDPKNKKNLKSQSNVFDHFKRSHTRRRYAPEMTKTAMDFIWVTNYGTTQPGSYLVSPLFEVVAIKCWYQSSRPREKMLKRALCFLLCVNIDEYLYPYRIVNKEKRELSTTEYEMYARKRKIKKTPITRVRALRRSGPNNYPRYHYMQTHLKYFTVTKGIREKTPVNEIERACEDVHELIYKAFPVKDVPGPRVYWLILNYILKEHTDYVPGLWGISWTSHYKDWKDLFAKENQMLQQAIGFARRSSIFQNFEEYRDKKFSNSLLRIVPRDNEIDIPGLDNIASKTNIFKKHGSFFYLNPDYIQIEGYLLRFDD